MDGRRSVHELAELAGIDEFTATKAVFGLVQAGFAAASGVRSAPGQDGRVGRQPGRPQPGRRLLPHGHARRGRAGVPSESSSTTPTTPRPATTSPSWPCGGDAEPRRQPPDRAPRERGPRLGVYLNLAYALRRQRRFKRRRLAYSWKPRQIAPTDPACAWARPQRPVRGRRGTAASQLERVPPDARCPMWCRPPRTTTAPDWPRR
jgi:hypothetical protein